MFGECAGLPEVDADPMDVDMKHSGPPPLRVVAS